MQKQREQINKGKQPHYFTLHYTFHSIPGILAEWELKCEWREGERKGLMSRDSWLCILLTNSSSNFVADATTTVVVAVQVTLSYVDVMFTRLSFGKWCNATTAETKQNNNAIIIIIISQIQKEMSSIIRIKMITITQDGRQKEERETNGEQC